MSGAAGGNRYEYANGVLRNRFGITDAALLQQAETTFVAIRQIELARQPITGRFDAAHLRAIHYALFQDVYEWAGEFRQVDISKGASPFAHFGYLDANARALFDQLEQEQQLRGLTPDQFAQRAAYYLGELNVLHPFREGNGRTQRIFFAELAHQAAYSLDWARISAQQMTDASILSLIHADNSGLEQLLLTVLAPLYP